MVWVAQIQEHVDYFKRQSTETYTYSAETQEEAQKLAVLWVMRNLADGDFYKLEQSRFSDEDRDVFLSRDPLAIWAWLEKNADKLYEGEYVNPYVEIEVYPRRSVFDSFSEEDFLKACDAAKDVLDPSIDFVEESESQETGV